MRWHCAAGEAGEGQVRRGKRRGRWVGSNAAGHGACVETEETRERRAESPRERWGCESAHLNASDGWFLFTPARQLTTGTESEIQKKPGRSLPSTDVSVHDG